MTVTVRPAAVELRRSGSRELRSPLISVLPLEWLADWLRHRVGFE